MNAVTSHWAYEPLTELIQSQQTIQLEFGQGRGLQGTVESIDAETGRVRVIAVAQGGKRARMTMHISHVVSIGELLSDLSVIQTPKIQL